MENTRVSSADSESSQLLAVSSLPSVDLDHPASQQVDCVEECRHLQGLVKKLKSDRKALQNLLLNKEWDSCLSCFLIYLIISYHIMKQCDKSFTFSARKRILRVPSAFISKASSPTSVVKLHCRKKKVRERIENENFSLFVTHFSRPFFCWPHWKAFEGLCVTLHSNFLQVICCKNVFVFFNMFCPDLPLSPFKPAFCQVMHCDFSPVSDSFAICIAWTPLLCHCIRAGRLTWSWAEMCTHLCIIGKTFCLLCQLASEQKCIVRACEEAFCFWTMYACTLFCLKGKIKHLVTWQTWENLFYSEA